MMMIADDDETDSGRVDEKVVKVDEVLEQRCDVRRIIVALRDRVSEQVQRPQRLEATKVHQLNNTVTPKKISGESQ